MIVEAHGRPLGVVVAAANVHDTKLLDPTIESIAVERPKPTKRKPQHLCLDKGYDNPTGHATVAKHYYTPHIRRIGEEKLDEKKPPRQARGRRKKHPARRYVVERFLGWTSKCRAILVRYAKKSSNYLGLIKLDCVLLWYRRLTQLQSN